MSTWSCRPGPCPPRWTSHWWSSPTPEDIKSLSGHYLVNYVIMRPLFPTMDLVMRSATFWPRPDYTEDGGHKLKRDDDVIKTDINLTFSGRFLMINMKSSFERYCSCTLYFRALYLSEKGLVPHKTWDDGHKVSLVSYGNGNIHLLTVP